MLEKIFKFISKELVLITLFIQGVGFTYFVLYFNYFSIPILYYLSLTDILLYTLMVLVLYSSYLLLFRYLIIDSIINFLYSVNKELHDNSWMWGVIAAFHIILTLCYYYLLTKLSYQLPIYTLMFGVFMSGTAVMSIAQKSDTIPENAEVNMSEEGEQNDPQKKIEERIGLLKFFLIVFSLSFISIIMDAERVKKNNTTVSFSMSQKDFYVGYKSKVKFIGETSLYIFTHDTLTKISTAYNKSEIQKIKFYPY